MPMSPQQKEAAPILFGAVVAAFKSAKTLNAETAVVAAARMAGALRARSLGADAGRASDDVARMLATLEGTVESLGVRIDASRAGSSLDDIARGLPPFAETQRTLQAGCDAAQRQFALDDAEAAEAMLVATALLVQQGARSLDPSTAFAIAGLGLAEGLQVVPAPAER